VKVFLLPLMGMLCAATWQSHAADLVVSHQAKPHEEFHAAVTDRPEMSDMSHADPKTWHTLPSAMQVYHLRPARSPSREVRELPNSLAAWSTATF
jgi:hypothetical protein